MIIVPLAMLAVGGWMIWKNDTYHIPLPRKRSAQTGLSRFLGEDTDGV